MSPAFEDGSPVSDPWKLRPMRSSQEILCAPRRPSRPSFSLIKKKKKMVQTYTLDLCHPAR